MAAQLTSPAPTDEHDRIRSLDVIRGFALLGILGPNIVSFAWPEEVIYSPGVMAKSLELIGGPPPLTIANELGHNIVLLFFFGKMMLLFGLLFGGGATIFSQKFEHSQAPLAAGAALWYRRMFWLLIIGLMHGLLLWYGDILVFYALVGMGALWWVRRWRPVRLLTVGSVIYALATLVMTTLVAVALWSDHTGQADLVKGVLAPEIAAYQGDFAHAFVQRLDQLIVMYFFVFPLFFAFAGTGIMMAGMALTNSGVLTGRRSRSFYFRLAGIGLTLGIGLTAATLLLLHSIGIEDTGFVFYAIGQLLGIPTSLGYAAVLILLVQTNRLRWMTTAFAAVGRMALTNYLLQSLICTTIFYGHGFGLFAQVQYPGMGLVVLGVWTVNIALSLTWLRFFRFGPAEWLWRCLTYLRWFDLRRPAPSQ